MQVMEELVPKETGRDARIDKKRTMNQQRRDREESPGFGGRGPTHILNLLHIDAHVQTEIYEYIPY